MHTIVEIVSSTSSICMDLTYFIKPGMKNENNIIATIIATNSVDRDRIQDYFVILKHSDHPWTKLRIRTFSLQKGKYNMTVTFPSVNIFIGDIDIHSCTKAGVLHYNQLTE